MEYLLYGIPAGETERYMEDLLIVRTKMELIEKCKVLAAADGFHGFRVATYSGEAPDFAAAVR